MQIKIQKTALARGLSVVSKTVGNKGTIPILGNILLDSDGNGLKLGATNLEMSITCEVEVEEADTFKTTVPSKIFNELIAAIQSEELCLEYDPVKLTLTITTDKSNNNIRCLSADDFPDMPNFPEEATISMPSEEFRQLIQRSAFCAASSEASNMLYQGILLETKDGELAVCATNGFRFSIEKLPVKCPDFSSIVPAAYANEVSRVSTEEVSLAIKENSTVFKTGDVVASVLNLDGNFPKLRDYDAKIEDAVEIVAPTADLFRAVKHASIFCDEEKRTLRLDFKLISEISAQADQVGDSVVNLALEVNGEVVTNLNADYLVGILSVAPEKVKIYVADENKPVVFKFDNVPDYKHVIMPIKV